MKRREEKRIKESTVPEKGSGGISSPVYTQSEVYLTMGLHKKLELLEGKKRCETRKRQEGVLA